MIAQKKRGCRWQGALLVVLLGLAALPGWSAAPPVPSGQLTAAQQQRLLQLNQELFRAAHAGKMGEALRLAREVEALRRRWQGARHWQTIDARYAIERWVRRARLNEVDQKEAARALRRKAEADRLAARHRYAEAEKALREVLAIHEKLLGAMHPEVAGSYANLAINLHVQGKYHQAQQLFQKALDLLKKLLGEEHPDTANSYNNLAVNLDTQGKYSQAQPLYQKALDLRKQLLGELHPDTATSYGNLAMNLNEQGKYPQAQPLHQKALDLRKQLLGELHPDTATSYNNLAMNLNAQGKHSEAQPLFQKALDLYKRRLGEQHPYTANSYNNLASNLDDQGKHSEAQRLYQKALDLHKQLLGEQHPQTALSYANLAYNLNAQGKYSQAQPLLQKALELRKTLLGEMHPDTAQSYSTLAANLNGQGKHREAQPLFQKALDLRKQRLGEEHPDTANSYNNLAVNLNAQGKYSQAQPLYQKALELRKQLLGEQHPDTASSYNNLAANLYAQGKHREAIRAWQAALLGHDAGRLARASTGFDRALLGADLLAPRQGLVLAHARLQEPILACQYAEADLARGLLDDLGEALDEDAALVAQLKRLDERLLPLLASGQLTEDQKCLRGELTGQRRELLRRLAKDVAARSAQRVWSLQRIRKHLPNDGALVLWVSVQNENWGCVLRAQGEPRWQRLAGTGARGSWTVEDRGMPARLHAALADRNSSTTRRRELIEAVRKRWFDPLVQHLKATGKRPAVRRLFVVPSGEMASLPVEVIAPQWTVSYTSSGTLLAQTLAGHRPLKASWVLALGDPVFAPAKPAKVPSHGLLVARVLPGGNAARAGLLSGDVLLQYAGSQLTTLADLASAVKTKPKGEAVVWREGKERTVVLGSPLGLMLDKRPAGEAVRAWRTLHQPVVRSTSYQALPGTRYEVLSLQRLLGKRCRTLLGSDASEQQLDDLARTGQLKQFRVLHLATHGKIDLGQPHRSALILARDRLPSPDEQAERVRKGLKVYNGELRVGTILQEWKQKLDCDLVVLSACETALGRRTSGQGLLGFAYALQVAGARSVVLSRWKVDDTATALLMLRFYENLLGAPKRTKALTRAAALQEAKTWLRDLSRKEAQGLAAALVKGKLSATRASEVELKLSTDAVKLPAGARPFAHPAFWAAFTLLGDPD
jgi:tetratricopeptide (TPR) repeat protein